MDVTGAATEADARAAARAVVGSSLVKAALHGEDPNWGRVFAAVGYSRRAGRSRARRAVDRLGRRSRANGVTTGRSKDAARAQMHRRRGHLARRSRPWRRLGPAWGCDLTEGYVVENSAYST